jgi:hypothetical protein
MVAILKRCSRWNGNRYQYAARSVILRLRTFTSRGMLFVAASRKEGDDDDGPPASACLVLSPTRRADTLARTDGSPWWTLDHRACSALCSTQWTTLPRHPSCQSARALTSLGNDFARLPPVSRHCPGPVPDPDSHSTLFPHSPGEWRRHHLPLVPIDDTGSSLFRPRSIRSQ